MATTSLGFNLSQSDSAFHLIASNLNIVAKNSSGNDVQIYTGNEKLLNELFTADYPLPFYITHDTTSGITTTSTTTKPVDEEQLEVSNSILDNIKTVVTNIINLPSKIAEAIGGFFTSLGETLLNGLEYLFVPSDNLFEDLINLLHEKFEFVFQILEIGDFIIDYDFDDSPPDASVDFSGKKGLNWGSGKIQFINWEMIEPYRNLIKNLTLAIAWYFFIRKVQKRLPDIINGVSSGGND